MADYYISGIHFFTLCQVFSKHMISENLVLLLCYKQQIMTVMAGIGCCLCKKQTFYCLFPEAFKRTENSLKHVIDVCVRILF